MRSSDLAPVFASFGGTPDLGFRQGTVIAWDSSTGSNVIEIAGERFTDLPVVSSADSVMLAPSDLVAVMRFKSTYLVLGRIGVAGQGAPGIKADYTAADQSTSSGTYGNLATVGPTVAAYIGSSRNCLVLLRSSIGITDNGGAMSFEVSGASSISATYNASASAFLGGIGTIISSATSFAYLSEADGLNQGQNTFQAKYARHTGTGSVDFKERQMTVFPF